MANDAVLPPVRLEAGLLKAARLVAAARDETLSQVVRRSLRAYVASAPHDTEIAAAIAADRAKKLAKE